MVSTQEILYVLLITLAAGGGYVDETGVDAYNAILPLLLLLLFSTNNNCYNNCNNCCGRLGTTTNGVFGRIF